MPEMPEVETVRRTLTPLVKGKTIAKINIWYPKIIVMASIYSLDSMMT